MHIQNQKALCKFEIMSEKAREFVFPLLRARVCSYRVEGSSQQR